MTYSTKTMRSNSALKKKSSCNHAIFTLLEAINHTKSKKQRLYTVAIDFSKAFDKVNRLFLWTKLIDMKVDPAIIQALILYYMISEIIIQLEDKFSDSFYSTVGVRQGGVLSPRLFSIFIHAMIELVTMLNLGISIGDVKIDIIAYADNILIITNIKKHAQLMLNEISNYCNTFEIKINADKTILIIFYFNISRTAAEINQDIWQEDLILQNIILKRTDNMKYLGIHFTDDSKFKTHTEKRISATIKASAALKNFGLQDEILKPHIKSNMYKTFVMPILTYGYDLIIPNKCQINSLRRTETNIIKQTLNISIFSRHSSLLRALNIKPIENRIYIAQLALYRRLTENDYTNRIILATSANNCESEYMKRIRWLTSSYSDSFSTYDKCQFEIDAINKDIINEKKSDENVKIITSILGEQDPSKLKNKLSCLLSYSNNP